jgi:hypothetical protein
MTTISCNPQSLIHDGINIKIPNTDLYVYFPQNFSEKKIELINEGDRFWLNNLTKYLSVYKNALLFIQVAELNKNLNLSNLSDSLNKDFLSFNLKDLGDSYSIDSQSIIGIPDPNKKRDKITGKLITGHGIYKNMREQNWGYLGILDGNKFISIFIASSDLKQSKHDIEYILRQVCFI